MTKFGRLKDSDLLDLLIKASWSAIQDGKAEEAIDYVAVGVMSSGKLNNQSAVSSALVD
ncbi:unnamed protein product, partial [marine sediment metagenome]